MLRGGSRDTTAGAWRAANVSSPYLDALLDVEGQCLCSLCSEIRPNPILSDGCNLCGDEQIAYGLLCMSTGWWRAEYCSRCASQQKEEGVVCVKHGENIEVNVYNDTSDEFIELHGKWRVWGPLNPLLKRLQGDAAPAIGRQHTAVSWQGCQWTIAATWCNFHKCRTDKPLSPPKCWTSIPGCGRAARFCLADRFRRFQLCLQTHRRDNHSEDRDPSPLLAADLCSMHARDARQKNEAGGSGLVDPQAIWRCKLRAVLFRPSYGDPNSTDR
ncbi:hypothetical protein GUITHDRAFT_99069 [Guillardia theta CCMP2712]|uniref:Uncharacterized protein n=1 Tax=Guillardia theta (strain CCMP2712) TaxID=905079 RepID=L1K402_GUITC|nr:hypothetical protein GUITHDRAFT_99069 [Guillardia theta CCMP2712]EKX55287.1 hypothetical protein GUITHDRAFT_99069 [Guillardia theta CCMP2712]|eukprot:XP_005842267.1 hypothetical protein GUITHDRAFT_99069 [Guillardia theta CCMP2712]